MLEGLGAGLHNFLELLQLFKYRYFAEVGLAVVGTVLASPVVALQSLVLLPEGLEYLPEVEAALRVLRIVLKEGFIGLPALGLHACQLVDLSLLVVDFSLLEAWLQLDDPLVTLARICVLPHAVIGLRDVVVRSD